LKLEPLIGIAIILLLVFSNGFFAMAEIALLSVRKSRLEKLANEGNKRAATALRLARNPNQLLSTAQIGITLVGILSGVLAGSTLSYSFAVTLQNWGIKAPFNHIISYTLFVVLTTYLSLVIGELIPKRLALNDPEKFSLKAAGFMGGLEWLATPLVRLLSKSTDLGLKIMRVKPKPVPTVTEEEIKILLEKGAQVGVFEESEQDMVEGVFRFGDRTIDDIMTPRSDIEWLDLEESPKKLTEQVLSSHHTRFPVGKGSLDNVLGILLLKDLLAARLKNDEVDFEAILTPILFVPESLEALKLLDQFKKSGSEIAIVIDEYGGTLGLVTLHDVLTAIVGEIPLPGETAEPQVIEREDGSWLLDGLLPVEELKDLIDVAELPDEDKIGFQTVGGFLMSQLDGIPISGQFFNWQGWHFEVMDMDGRRVDKILVTRIKQIPEHKK
jgi:putative hemolysin